MSWTQESHSRWLLACHLVVVWADRLGSVLRSLKTATSFLDLTTAVLSSDIAPCVLTLVLERVARTRTTAHADAHTHARTYAHARTQHRWSVKPDLGRETDGGVVEAHADRLLERAEELIGKQEHLRGGSGGGGGGDEFPLPQGYPPAAY